MLFIHSQTPKSGGGNCSNVRRFGLVVKHHFVPVCSNSNMQRERNGRILFMRIDSQSPRRGDALQSLRQVFSKVLMQRLMYSPYQTGDLNWSVSRGKRIFDVGVAALILVVALLPMLLIACLIHITSDGHILFRQSALAKTDAYSASANFGP
uniref:Uncharacterized protein n=1 Tax=mine drainage metagenome TaxID=410659 RepID=E6PYW7_9ZZZZ